MNGDTTDAILEVFAKPGEPLTFDASGSTDPDDDPLAFSWRHYAEAGRKPWGKSVLLESADTPTVTLTVPADSLGSEIHLVLEVTDKNEIVPLVDYRRVVIYSASTAYRWKAPY